MKGICMKKFKLFLLTGCIAFSASSLAADAPSASVVDSIAKLNEQVAIMSAKLKVLELEQQIVTKRSAIDNLSDKHLNSESLPSVTSIEITGAKNFVTFTYPDGITIFSEVGDVLPDSWEVDSIGKRVVVIKKGKSKKTLYLASMPAQASNPAIPDLPPMPPMLNKGAK